MSIYFFHVLVDTPFNSGKLVYQHNEILLVGVRALVPLGSRICTGVILKQTQRPLSLNQIRSIHDVIDPFIVINEKGLQLLEWVCAYYHFSFGRGLFFALPRWMKKRNKISHDQKWIVLISEKIKVTGKKQQLIVDYLKSKQNKVLLQSVTEFFPKSKSSIQSLSRKGVIKECMQAIEAKKTPAPKIVQKYTLHAEQKQTFNQIIYLIKKKSFFCHFINGETGSGKTEVYLHLIEHILKSHQVLLLAPEIVLTYHLKNYLEKKLDQQVPVFHSGLSEKEKCHIWKSVLTGDTRLLIGTRSAIFLPFKELGLIIIDEAHDTSFKQNDGAFRYCGKHAAIMRAKLENIGVVLGSGTPDLNALYNIEHQKWSASKMSRKANIASGIDLHLIDMKKQPNQILSPPLIQAIKQALNQQQQVMLFLNQRGFARCIYCTQCQHVIQCPNCEKPVVLHQDQKIHCHLCCQITVEPKICPQCHEASLKPLGYGTQRIENIIGGMFNAPIFRIDRDQIKDNLKSIQRIKEGISCIVIGTQMIAKGHHFPQLTVSGILNADQGLLSPDFYQQERFLQLITQLFGRVGRGHQKGTVFIQTQMTDHPIWRLVHQANFYEQYIKRLMHERKCFQLPPFKYHLLIRARSKHRFLLKKHLDQLSACLKEDAKNITSVKVHTPMPALIEKVSSAYRYYVLLESKNRTFIQAMIKNREQTIERIKRDIKGSIAIDPDPIDMY